MNHEAAALLLMFAAGCQAMAAFDLRSWRHTLQSLGLLVCSIVVMASG